MREIDKDTETEIQKEKERETVRNTERERQRHRKTVAVLETTAVPGRSWNDLGQTEDDMEGHQMVPYVH